MSPTKLSITPEKIKRLRLDMGYTQEEMAKEMKVSLATIARWESGKSVPTRRTMLDLSDMIRKPFPLPRK